MVRVLLLFLQAQKSKDVARVERTGRERIPLLHRRLPSWEDSASGAGVIGCEAGDIEADDKKRDSAGFD